MKLSDRRCKTALPKEKPYKITDGDGMYLLINPNGTKLWRLNYRFDGKFKTLALGVFPRVSLADAREKRRDARIQISKGVDPAVSRAEGKLLSNWERVNTFEAVAREWHTKNKNNWSTRYSSQVLRNMENNLFPDLGSKLPRRITPIMLMAVIRKMEDRGATDYMADTLNYAGRVFRYCIVTGRAERDPSSDLKGAFIKHKSKRHRSLKPEQLPEFLRTLDRQIDGNGKWGLQLVLLTLVRTTEARAAPWSEFNLSAAKWVIPPERMKGRREHTVPLSRQALAHVNKMKARTGNSSHVFPSYTSKHPFMSDATMLRVIEQMGYKEHTTVHGIRALGSTILHESGKFRSLAIERQLAHVDKDGVRDTYNNAEYLKERKKLVQWWADYLDQQAARKETSHPAATTNKSSRRN